VEVRRVRGDGDEREKWRTEGMGNRGTLSPFSGKKISFKLALTLSHNANWVGSFTSEYQVNIPMGLRN
jgi:hypothetical protein